MRDWRIFVEEYFEIRKQHFCEGTDNFLGFYMSYPIQNLTRQIFRSFGFRLEKNPEKGLQQIQGVLESSLKSPIVALSTTGPSLAAVGTTPRVKNAKDIASEYAVRLHREIYNKPINQSDDAIKMQKKRADLAKYLLASALFFSKLQEDSVNCHGLVTAISTSSPLEEVDIAGYENFKITFRSFSSLSDEERQTKFQQLRDGAKKEGESSCRQFGDFFHTSQIRQTWSQSFAGMMKCFDNDAQVLGCLDKK